MTDWQADPRYLPSLNSPLDELEPWLFIGSMYGRDHVTMRGINRIISLGLPSDRIHWPAIPGVREIPLTLEDSERNIEENLHSLLEMTWAVLALWQKEGYRVLVHCSAGVSRSAFVVLHYLMKRDKLSFHKALTLLEQKRYCCNPNPLFQRVLKKS